MEKKRDKSSLTVSTLWLLLALHSVSGWKETGSPRTVVFRFWIDMDHVRTWWKGWAQVAERGEAENEKGFGVAKEMETLREVSIVPMFVQRTSPHPKGLLTTWTWKVVAITAFLLPSLHMLPEVFHLHFPYFSMFLAADIHKSWTNGCGKHANWLHSEHAGSTQGAAAAACSVSICTAHVPQGWGTAQLLGWDMEPGHPAAPLEQVEMWLSEEDLFWSNPGLVGGKVWGSSAWLLGALAQVDHHDEEVSGLQKKYPGWKSCFVSSSAGVQKNG